MSQYSTNLTDKQWQVIKKFINTQERKRKHHLRDIVNAILYINKTGCQWRMLPSHFAPWQTVYYYFRKWKLEGVIEEIMDTLHSLVRKMAGREESPSMGMVPLVTGWPESSDGSLKSCFVPTSVPANSK